MSTHAVDNNQVPLFIEGKTISSANEAAVDVINPSNGRRCRSIPRGCNEDVNRAVASSRAAFEDGRWSEAPPSFRKKALHCLGKLIGGEAQSLDAGDALEMGKPVSETLANGLAAAELTHFYAEAVGKVNGESYGSDRNSLVVGRKVPRGVVAAVVPWNFPTYNVVLKCAPALAAGNCVVLKPSELSPSSALRFAHLAMEAGIPPGVVNVLPGLGEVVGRGLGLHPDVDMIAFTGSTEIGKAMLQYSGQSNMKVVMAECGGKSAQVVFDDGVDPAAAGEAIARLLLTNQGQLCTTGSRLVVQRSVESKVLESVLACISRIVIGDAIDPQTTFGPLASAGQCARVLRYINAAQTEGAELVAGGRRINESSGGYFVEPTVFRRVQPSARIAQEEIFGPVLAVIPFEDESEALSIVNGTVYGLMAYVWTSDLSRGMRMAKRIRSPVAINAAMPLGEGAGDAPPFEPARQSGIGVEGGLAGMESYLRRQSVWFSHA